MRAERDEAEREDGIDCDGGDEQQKMRPVGEVREQQEACHECGLDDCGSEKSQTVISPAPVNPVERGPAHCVNIIYLRHKDPFLQRKIR